jgi:hypothetical protein
VAGEIDAFDAAHQASAAIEDLRVAFLDRQVGGSDRLAAAFAGLERGLLAARAGQPGRVEITFEVDPRPVLDAVIGRSPLPGPELPAGRFRVQVSSDIPGLMRIDEVGPPRAG